MAPLWAQVAHKGHTGYRPCQTQETTTKSLQRAKGSEVIISIQRGRKRGLWKHQNLGEGVTFRHQRLALLVVH